ncbi:MAG: ParB/RepB/Spo0J family partition protein [Clostridia bacterium]|nr:ParB/RepB/Spo0J family partition protein [Clostridia bacterium]
MNIGHESIKVKDESCTTFPEKSHSEDKKESIREIPLSLLRPFRKHPFRVIDDVRMTETADSIKEYGVLVPAIVRPLSGGTFELISGHRRKRACELAGLETMPVIVRELDDDEAVIVMVDSNLQRENILPSERAKAYKMKVEALRRKAGRPSKEKSSQVGTHFRADEKVAEDSGISRNQVRRFIRLNNLVPDLIDMVDDKKVAMSSAVELSFLKPEEQEQLVDAMEVCQSVPSLSQAQRMKNFSKQGKLTGDVMDEIMHDEKESPLDKVILPGEKIRKFFPRSYTIEQIEQVIISLLESWCRSQMLQSRY